MLPFYNNRDVCFSNEQKIAGALLVVITGGFLFLHTRYMRFMRI